MNLPNNTSAPDAKSMRGLEAIEALLRADAQREKPIHDDGFTARVMALLPVQRAESPWRWALPHLIVVLGVMAVLLAGNLMHGLDPHALTVDLLACPIGIPWASFVVGAAVSMGVFFSLDVPWPWDSDDPLLDPCAPGASSSFQQYSYVIDENLS
ncbi:hypothetical protein [Metallibacterium sp.]|jgi:hypothetical protein|uniref:hypothetical protein n=1 Tax=Metallibacterium sp. TaxID=2940281 RepID=UPI0026184D61|nr:hypothetical protein [Metallibacterium sp.]